MKTKYNPTLLAAGAESGDQTQNYSIRGRWFAVGLGGFLLTSIFALSTPSMEAQCEQWDVSGKWKIRQGSFTLPVVLTQKGKTVTGSALHRDATTIPESSEQGFGERGDLEGSVNGTVEGDKFDVQINWARGGVGIYRGTIGKNGVIQGMTYDKNKPSSSATWRSSKVMKCAEEDAAEPTNPTPVRPPPLKSTGHMPTNPTPSRPPPLKSTGHMPKIQSPTISANPIAVTFPEGQSQGTTTLTWDGGPDHPDAQVWMKQGIEGEETLVAEQGKGTRRVTVERGKNYQFILKDSGQQLAKAVVISRH
jgi:hypothetical protein